MTLRGWRHKSCGQCNIYIVFILRIQDCFDKRKAINVVQLDIIQHIFNKQADGNFYLSTTQEENPGNTNLKIHKLLNNLLKSLR